MRFLAFLVTVLCGVAFVAGFEGFGGFLAGCAGGLGVWEGSEELEGVRIYRGLRERVKERRGREGWNDRRWYSDKCMEEKER